MHGTQIGCSHNLVDWCPIISWDTVNDDTGYFYGQDSDLDIGINNAGPFNFYIVNASLDDFLMSHVCYKIHYIFWRNSLSGEDFC